MMRPFNDVDLHAFVDKQVGPDRRVAIASYLATAPDDAARVDLWTRQNEAVRALFATGASEPVPLWLTVGQILSTRDGSAAAKRPAGAGGRPGLRAAGRSAARRRTVPVAVAVLAFVGGAALALGAERLSAWAGRPAFASEAGRGFDTAALEAHRLFSLDPDRPADVPPAQARAFLQARVPFPVRIPELGAAGWRLLGGRLVATEGGAGTLLVYGDPAGARLSLVAGQAPPDAVDSESAQAGRKVVAGTDRGVRYAWSTSKDEDWLESHAAVLRQSIQDAPAD